MCAKAIHAFPALLQNGNETTTSTQGGREASLGGGRSVGGVGQSGETALGQEAQQFSSCSASGLKDLRSGPGPLKLEQGSPRPPRTPSSMPQCRARPDKLTSGKRDKHPWAMGPWGPRPRFSDSPNAKTITRVYQSMSSLCRYVPLCAPFIHLSMTE